MEEFKIAAEGHAQNLQNSVLSIKHKTDHIRNELDSVQNIFQDAHSLARAKSKPRDESMTHTSGSYSRSRYNPVNSMYKPGPLDSKLERYKKTAEDRKSQNRSGSNNAGRAHSEAKNFRLLNEKVKELEVGFNNICIVFQAREEEFEGLKEIIEDNENDQFAFIYHTEEAFNYLQQIASPDEEVKGDFDRQGYEGPVQGRRIPNNSGSYYSTDSIAKHGRRDASPDMSPTFDDIKMQDLQRTNELLLKELRISNDKYFNERLESKKLKDELDILRREVKIISKEKPIKTTTTKRNLNEVCKENDTLKERIEKLEQECNSLTYYRENMLSNSNAFSFENFDPEMRRAFQESDLLRNKLESTTIYVKKFLLAMKRLQRGVKTKDPNNKSLKLEFERCKKELEDWCRNLKEEFASNRSRSRSKDRSYSPAGSYSRSRMFSPNTTSPGNITPKGINSNNKSKNKDSSSNKRNKSANAVNKSSEGFKSLIQDPNYAPSRQEMMSPPETIVKGVRQPNFDSRDKVSMFSSDKKQDLQKEQMQSVNPPDLSRTTFGMKNSKSPAEPTSSSHVPREEYNNLKLMVTNMVVEKDKELRHRLNDITDDLNKKTVALNKMKRTLVSKLKELENSLIAPSQEFNRSLDADATSSHEERGESQLAEVNEKKRKLERDLEQNKDLLEAKIRENQNLSQDLVKLKNDLQVNRGELETTIAKQKACELEIELKKFEVSELEKFKIKQSKQINELQQKIFDQEDNFKIEKLKSNKNLEAQIFKLQDLESQQIKGKLELSNKIKSKEKELSLKTSLVEDYKNQIKQMGDEISMLKIQNNKLSLSQQINPAEGQEGSLSNLLNTDEEEDETSKRLKELKQLIASDPTKASNDLFRLCFDTAKEYRILKKTTEILEDNIDEMKEDMNEMKSDERATVEKMLIYEVKLLELEKENVELKKHLDANASEINEESSSNSKDKEQIEKLNTEIEKLTKKLNDTSDLHRNQKVREKKMEGSMKEAQIELGEYKQRINVLENDNESHKQRFENDINRLQIQLNQAEEERDLVAVDLKKAKDETTLKNEELKKFEQDLKTSQSLQENNGAEIDEIEILNKNLEQVDGELTQAKKGLENQMFEQEKKHEQLQQTQDELELTNEYLKGARDGLEKAEIELENKNKNVEEFKQKLDEITVELKTTKDDLEQANRQADISKNLLEQISKDIESSKDEIQRLTNELEQTKNQLDLTKKDDQGKQDEYERLSQQYQDIQDELNTAHKDLESTQKELNDANSE